MGRQVEDGMNWIIFSDDIWYLNNVFCLVCGPTCLNVTLP